MEYISVVSNALRQQKTCIEEDWDAVKEREEADVWTGADVRRWAVNRELCPSANTLCS